MEFGGVGAAIGNREADSNIFGPALRVFNLNIEIAIGREDAGVLEFKLALIAAAPAVLFGEAEETLLEDRVLAVPECERKAKPALVVADPEKPVLSPSVGAAAGVIVRKGIPAIAPRGVIFAHGSPLAFRQVGAPAAPRLLVDLLQAKRFGISGCKGHA